MGLVRKLAQRVVEGVKAVREEARHPGRPPGFKASSNPFYQAEEAAINQKAPERPKEDPGHAPPNEATEGTPWYLKGEQADAGWDETNPGLEPGRKWEEEKT